LVKDNIIYDTKGPAIYRDINGNDTAFVEGNEIFGNDKGIVSYRFVARGNWVHDNKGIGIKALASILDSNIVSGNGGGIQVSSEPSVTRSIIKNNKIFNNHGLDFGGLVVNTGAEIIQNLIFNNTSDNGGSGGIVVGDQFVIILSLQLLQFQLLGMIFMFLETQNLI
jgi:hypothetical protein